MSEVRISKRQIIAWLLLALTLLGAAAWGYPWLREHFPGQIAMAAGDHAPTRGSPNRGCGCRRPGGGHGRRAGLLHPGLPGRSTSLVG